MQWKKDSMDHVDRHYDLLIGFIILLFLVSLIANRPLIFLVIGFVVVFLFVIRFYDKRIGKHLELVNRKRSIRMFEGEEAEVPIGLKNHSYMPYYNGVFRFSTSDKVEGLKFLQSKVMDRNFYHVPLSISGNNEVRLSIPIKAMKRGVVRLAEIQYAFPHLFNFQNLTISYNAFYRTEVLVYPKPLPVKGIEDFSHTNFGNQPTAFSPFEDMLSPIGARDYVHSDPFHRIHWKASARSQTLQTKVYERNRNMAWTLIVNIAETSSLGNVYMSKHLEKILSEAAYMCQAITKMGYPLEIYVNAARAGKTPLYLSEGSGPEHLKKALELLTRVDSEGHLMHFRHLLHRVDHSIGDANIVAIVGEVSAGSYSYTDLWNRRGNRVFRVTDTPEGAILTNVSSRGASNDVAK